MTKQDVRIVAARICQLSAVATVGSFTFLVIENMWFSRRLSDVK